MLLRILIAASSPIRYPVGTSSSGISSDTTTPSILYVILQNVIVAPSLKRPDINSSIPSVSSTVVINDNSFKELGIYAFCFRYNLNGINVVISVIDLSLDDIPADATFSGLRYPLSLKNLSNTSFEISASNLIVSATSSSGRQPMLLRNKSVTLIDSPSSTFPRVNACSIPRSYATEQPSNLGCTMIFVFGSRFFIQSL